MLKQKNRRRAAIVCFCSAITAIYTATAPAQTLLQVFQDALYNDPTFRQAESQWEANKQQLPIALAALLPQIDATAAINDNHFHENVKNHLTGIGHVLASDSFPSSNYAISLQQPIFNAALWYQLRGANATVKADTADYSAAFQNLIVRTVQAYLNVLQAYDAIRYTLANKRATYRQLVAAQQKFKVGLVALTEVYDAQSQYDAIVAQEIVNRSTLDNTLEQLQAITSHYYLKLAALGDKGVPLFPPEPAEINAWVRIAREQNYSIVAQQYITKAAYENIQFNAAGHYPTVQLQTSFSKQFSGDQPNTVTATIGNPDGQADVTQENATIGLNFNLPIYSGGAVIAKTEQARYLYANAAATLELTHRTVVSQTRQAYLGVISEISQIQADIQAIKSAANAVGSTEAGYKVGTRTIVDVLNDLTHLYQTQQQLAVDQYNYINNFVLLKNNAGTLSIDDLRLIDTWLTVNADFSGEYAPTRVRMEEGTFSYTYNHHEIAEEKGLGSVSAANITVPNLNAEEENAYEKTNTTNNVPLSATGAIEANPGGETPIPSNISLPSSEPASSTATPNQPQQGINTPNPQPTSSPSANPLPDFAPITLPNTPVEDDNGQAAPTLPNNPPANNPASTPSLPPPTLPNPLPDSTSPPPPANPNNTTSPAPAIAPTPQTSGQSSSQLSRPSSAHFSLPAPIGSKAKVVIAAPTTTTISPTTPQNTTKRLPVPDTTTSPSQASLNTEHEINLNIPHPETTQ